MFFILIIYLLYFYILVLELDNKNIKKIYNKPDFGKLLTLKKIKFKY